MRIAQPLLEGVFLQRYKRFFADVEMPDGSIITAHCPNSGSMKGCNIPGSKAWISDSMNPKRKLRHTLEILEIDGVRMCVNTHRPNGLVEEAIRDGQIPELAGYDVIRREVRYGSEKSRIDLLLERGEERCYVEVKSVTLGGSEGLARFPDAVTTRGTKHLRELMGVVDDGDRAVLMFCASRDDTLVIEPADEIDLVYGRTLRQAHGKGVEILAYGLDIEPPVLALRRAVEVRLPALSDESS
jgi:sugar fermentation stimulation protein A